MRRTCLPPAVVAIAVLALSACTASPDGGGEATAKPSFEITADTPDPSGELESLTWATYAEPSSLDYAYSFDYAANQVLANVCESLLRLNADMSVSPGLASGVENPTPTTWVYTIRDGVEFHDGSMLTADDVVASMSRHIDPSVGSYWYSAYANVERIEKTDSDEVTVTLAVPDALFNEALSGAAGVIESAATLRELGADYGNSTGGVNCTGPFALESWQSGEKLTFSRFDEYWDPDLAPKAEKLEILVMADSVARVNALRSGEVDGGWMVPTSAVGELNASGEGTVYFGLNTAVNSLVAANLDGPLGNPEVRKALLMAIDRDGLIVAAENGYATRTNALTSTSVWDQADEATQEAAFAGLADYPHDVEAAAEIIEEEGVAGEEIVIATAPISNTFSVVAQATAAAAESIGLKATINTMTPSAYTSLFSDPSARTGVDLFFNIWYLSTANPLEMFGILRTGEFSNYGGWSNPEYDEVVTRGLQSTDQSAGFAASLEAQKTLNEEIPWLPLYETPNLLWMNNRITGASPSVNFLYFPWAAEIGAK